MIPPDGQIRFRKLVSAISASRDQLRDRAARFPGISKHISSYIISPGLSSELLHGSVALAGSWTVLYRVASGNVTRFAEPVSKVANVAIDPREHALPLSDMRSDSCISTRPHSGLELWLSRSAEINDGQSREGVCANGFLGGSRGV